MAIITLENAVLVRMANQALINALAGEVESTENDMSAYAIYRELSRIDGSARGNAAFMSLFRWSPRIAQ